MKGSKWASDADRFWAKVDRSGGPSACWLWLASTREGYGQFKVGGKRGRMAKAHRVSWEMHNGPIPESNETKHGTCVLHRCDNPRCVNPDHLFLGSQRDNMDDRQAKGRTGRGHGAKVSAAKKGKPATPRKLDADRIRAIRKMRAGGTSQKIVAAAFGVAPSLIWAIDKRLVWGHVA